MEIPDVRYVRNGDFALAYQVIGDGPVDLLYAPTPWLSNLEVVWDNPLMLGSCAGWRRSRGRSWSIVGGQGLRIGSRRGIDRRLRS